VFAVFGREVVTLLLRGGSFDLASTDAVTTVLAAYAAGLPGNAASRVLASACFSVGDTSRPARYAVVRVIVSTGISLLLMERLGVAGVVLGAASAAWVELALLGHAARGHLGGLGLVHIAFGRIAIVVAAAIGAGLGARAGLGAAGVTSAMLGSAVALAVVGVALLAGFDRLGVLPLRSVARRRTR
jgi:putative peptidoglycan lipid II flippase